MKYLTTLAFLVSAFALKAQDIVGTWQLTNEKTCFQTQFEKTDTEKELEGSMGQSRNTEVAKLMTFDKKGSGTEGVFTVGSKKGSNKNEFQWKLVGQELQFVDKKSGIISQRFVVDELSASILRIHEATRDCEIKEFSKVK